MSIELVIHKWTEITVMHVLCDRHPSDDEIEAMKKRAQEVWPSALAALMQVRLQCQYNVIGIGRYIVFLV